MGQIEIVVYASDSCQRQMVKKSEEELYLMQRKKEDQLYK